MELLLYAIPFLGMYLVARFAGVQVDFADLPNLNLKKYLDRFISTWWPWF